MSEIYAKLIFKASLQKVFFYNFTHFYLKINGKWDKRELY